MERSSTKVRKGRKPQQKIPRVLGSGDVIVKRMTIPSGSISTTAGGLVAVATYSSSLVQSTSATEWASFAARYQQYRVRRMRMSRIAIWNVTQSGGDQMGQATMYDSDWIGTSVPTSAAQVLADEKATISGSCQDRRLSVTWERNPNAKLWNPTSASIPAANQFGLALASGTTGAVLPSSAVVFTYSLEFDVELRGSQ